MSRPLRVVLATAMLLSTLSFAPGATAEPSRLTAYDPGPLKVAVVRSETTLTWLKNRGTPGRYPHGGKEKATFEYLVSRGYNVTEIIGDRDLLDPTLLAKYDVIVMPEVFCIGRKASENLARYVGNGGGLVSALSSPRADPAKANKPGTKNDMREWWWRQFKSNDWEWGPLSQVYQAKFANDNFTPKFRVNPRPANQLVKGAQEILDARGYSDDVSGMSILRDPGAGLELSKPLKNDVNASSAVDFQILDSTVRRHYPSTYAAAITARYHAGRSVYFYFNVEDFLPQYSTKLYSPKTSTGIPQGEVAGAYLESAIKWAGTPDGATGAQTSDVRAYANVRATSSGIRSDIRVNNRGPLITYGTLTLSIFNSKGKLVHRYTKKQLSSTASSTVKRSDYWGHSVSGRYRVVVKYAHGYPWESVAATSSASVGRGSRVTTR